MSKRAVFLDRDGTLLEVIHRPNHPRKFTAPFQISEYHLRDCVHSALWLMKDTDFMRIMVSNQPDVALGDMDACDWRRIHNTFLCEVPLEDWYVCRHRPEDNCPMMKPSSGMIIAAADKHDIDLRKSFMVGDTDADMLSGATAGCTTILIRAPYNTGVKADYYVHDLLCASKLIKNLSCSRE